MSLTVQQIISDAKKLSSRLKEHGTAADSLITQSQNVYKQIDAMKQYSDEVEDLNNTARQRPHSALVAGMQRENRYLRELQQENRELKAALEECQNALELIMSKYRQQVTQLLQLSRIDISKIYNDQYLEVIQKQSEKIVEMASVMGVAAQARDQNIISDANINRLSAENKELRDLLNISTKLDSQTNHDLVEEPAK